MSISAGFILPHPPLAVPAVGQGREAAIRETIESCRAAAQELARLRPQTVFLISPHSVAYADYIHISPGTGAAGSLRQFGAPAVYRADYDAPLVKELERLCAARGFPAGTLGERDAALDHGTLVPLHFINQFLTDYRLVRCSVSGLSRAEHYRFGILLREAVETLGREAVVVASGDLSHRLAEDGPYGFAPEGPELDRRLTQIMKTGDFGGFLTLDEALCEKGAQCGLNAFLILAGVFDRRAVKTRFYSYEGPLGVGYGVSAFADGGPDAARAFLDREEENERERLRAVRDGEDSYVRLARETLERYVVSGEMPPPPAALPEELRAGRAGAFVSIKKHGQLRGCIGTTGPTRPSLAEEIRQNAISAGTRDPRFPPVTADELSALVYSVDVLSPAAPCGEDELDAQRFGVIVTSGRKRGLLLPKLDGVDTAAEQLAIARRKAGIGEGEPCTLERFEVVRHT